LSRRSSAATSHRDAHDERMDSDWRLMKRLCERDERALAELYDRHGGRVFSLSAAILRDDAAAEECTQDVFVKLWHRPEQYRFDDNRFVVWLSLIARRTAIDRLRRAKRVSLGQVAFDDDALRDAPDLAQIEEARWRDIAHVLAQLPEDQRAAIELAYYHGLSQAEIAEHLGAPLGTIKTRVRLGMEKLRAALFPTKDGKPQRDGDALD
jgi:RNA polymerase sigma-70 factor (ECF subfamily)